MSGPFQPDDPEESAQIAAGIALGLVAIAVWVALAFGVLWLSPP